MVQNIYKNLLLVSKIAWGIWTTSGKQRKLRKYEILWATFVQNTHSFKTYIPSAKTVYTENFSNIIFNYLCKNLPNFLWHFWNLGSFFVTQILCIFLAQTLHNFYKSSPLKCKGLEFPLLGSKFTKLFVSFLK